MEFLLRFSHKKNRKVEIPKGASIFESFQDAFCKELQRNTRGNLIKGIYNLFEFLMMLR